MNRYLLSSIASGVAVVLTGCAMVPHYERPSAPVSSVWPYEQDVTNSATAPDVPWREFFTNPALQQVLAISLENNRDLRVAALRVEEARAQYRIERSALLPAVDAGAGVTRQSTPGTVSVTGKRYTSTTYQVDAGASYELDLFGRIRSLKEGALERYLALAETRKSVQIALLSEVASQYLTLVQLQDSRALAAETLRAVQTSRELVQKSFEAGVASELDFRTAEAQMETARVNLAALDQAVAQARNALILLAGQPLPSDLTENATLVDQPLFAGLPAGLPSDLLQRRPDILAAEHSLRAANADIGAARAAFFPRILLTGSAGSASAKLTDLFTGPSFAWSFAPQITVPIFQGGRLRASLDASKIRKEIEIATYEKAIQGAFREVADALAVREFIDEQSSAQERLVEAQQSRFNLTEARYRQGVDNYLDVLLAQQDLYAAQQGLLRLRTIRLLNAVTLYRALGGGWSPSTIASAP